MSDTIQSNQTTASADSTTDRPQPSPTGLRRPNPNPSVVKSRTFAYKWLIWAVLLFGLIYGGVLVSKSLSSGQTAVDQTLTHKISRRTIADTVVEHGTLESQSTVQGICRLHGWENRITFIVEEGAHVEEGDVVVRFDSSGIEEDLAEEKILLTKAQAAVDEAEQLLEVQKNENESAIATAKLEMTLAQLDLEKFKEGDYKAELAELERSIAESKAILAQKQEMEKNLRALVKKGFREPEQLRQMEQEVTSARFQLDRDNQKKEVLELYDHKRRITELESKAQETVRALARAKVTAKSNLAKAEYKLEAARKEMKIQQMEVEEEEEQLRRSEIVASQPGTVAYANSRYMDPNYRIRPGGTIHRRQTVFHLPDMSRMQVRLEIHESLINKIVPGQKATVRVESYPDVELDGTIDRIADLARSDGESDEQKYTAEILIDSFPEDVKLKPGMTAKTEIHIRTVKNVLAIPVQAVTEYGKKEFAYVKTTDGYKRTEIDTSAGNEAFLIVESGLDENDEVAMDAYQRGLEDFGTVTDDEELLGDDESEDSESESSSDNLTQPMDVGENNSSV